MAERRRKATRTPQYESAAYETWVERVAANVRRLREARGWTQEEAADMCELSRRHYQSVEAGTLNITVTTLARLTAGFDVDPIELVTAAAALRRVRPGRPKAGR
jgi:transcriptional regulator with XRE-family HTH domain